MAKLKVVKKKKELSIEEEVRDYVVPKIREYLEQYDGIAISPTVAIDFTTFIMELIDETMCEYPEICLNWLTTYINLLAWGFSGAIVITPEK